MPSEVQVSGHFPQILLGRGAGVRSIAKSLFLMINPILELNYDKHGNPCSCPVGTLPDAFQ